MIHFELEKLPCDLKLGYFAIKIMAFLTTVGSVISSADIRIEEEIPEAAESLLFYRNCFTVLIMFIIVIGNSSIIMCMIRFPWLRFPTNYLITSLSMTDLFMGCVILPLMIFEQMTPERRPSWICHFVARAETSIGFITIAHMLVINIERLICLQFPIRYHAFMTSVVTVVMVMMPWFFAAMDTTIAHMIMDFRHTKHCIVYPPESKLKGALMFSTFLLPFIVICVIYVRIGKIAKRHFDFGQQNGNCHRRSHCNCVTAIPSRTVHVKILHTVSIILGTFTLCWGPNVACSVAYGYASKTGRQILLHYGIPLAELLIYLRSAVNPSIYAFYCPKFKRAFAILMERKAGGRKRTKRCETPHSRRALSTDDTGAGTTCPMNVVKTSPNDDVNA